MTPFGVFNKVHPAGVKMYPQNYPHQDIAFAHVSDYTDGVEEMLIRPPPTRTSTGCGRMEVRETSLLGLQNSSSEVNQEVASKEAL